jgi:acyl transferase domain-containing protein
MPPTVFVFSGQGSQYFQMGRELFESDDTFRDWMVRLDDHARRSSGMSIIETLYSDTRRTGDPFDRTLLTHPAIFMVEYSLAQLLIHGGVRPDMALGVSVGSFAAAAVAGFIGVEDALTAVIRQAMVLEKWAEPGGMTAVFADPELFADDAIGRRAELAAVNFSSHFVVSARHAELSIVESALQRRNIGYQRLPVSSPFHSRWIDEARAPFASFMRTVQCRQGRLPLVCCERASTLLELQDGYFWDVVRNPIRFRETIARLEQEGPRRYVDIGPSGTLATFLKYGIPRGTRSTVHAVLTPYGVHRQNLATVLGSHH